MPALEGAGCYGNPNLLGMSFQPRPSQLPLFSPVNHCVLQLKGVLEPLGKLRPGWWEGRAMS